MKKAKRISCFVLAIFMLVSTMVVMIVPSSAATSSSGKQTRTIYVTTKANWWIPGSESITLKQTKGICENRKKAYGGWDIEVYATDGSHSYEKYWSDGSITLKLKPNKTYKITISWNGNAEVFPYVKNGKFTTLPTWKVSSTYKCSSYS